jgi:hypothetical protein
VKFSISKSSTAVWSTVPAFADLTTAAYTSEYFATLLGPGFKEGTDLDKAIELKEDDANGFAILCKILHMNLDSSELPLSSQDVLSLAVVADKYGCVKPTKLSLKAVFPDAIPTCTDFKQAGEHISAAYILDQASL